MTLSCYSLMGEESLLIKTDSSAGLVWGGDPRCWSHFGCFSSGVLWIIWLLQPQHTLSQIEGTVLTHWKVTISSIICCLLSGKQYQDLKLANQPLSLFLMFSHRCSSILNFIPSVGFFSLVQSLSSVTVGAIA